MDTTKLPHSTAANAQHRWAPLRDGWKRLDVPGEHSGPMLPVRD